MQNKYNCEHCEYSTDRKSSFNNHINSNKHKICIKHIIDKTHIHIDVNDPNKCKYCLKTLSCKQSLKRHLIKCNKKILSNEKLKSDTELIKIQKKLDKLKGVKHDYIDLLKQIAQSKTSPNTVNLNYILNNFIDVPNYNDIMKKPLTPAEIKMLLKLEPLAGTISIIEKRCIEGIPVDKRPLYCLDSSRNKYVVRIDNVWVIDHNAKKILKEAIKHLYSVYITDPSMNKELSTDIILKNQQKLMKIETKTAQNKMMNDLSDKIHIKKIKLNK